MAESALVKELRKIAEEHGFSFDRVDSREWVGSRSGDRIPAANLDYSFKKGGLDLRFNRRGWGEVTARLLNFPGHKPLTVRLTDEARAAVTGFLSGYSAPQIARIILVKFPDETSVVDIVEDRHRKAVEDARERFQEAEANLASFLKIREATYGPRSTITIPTAPTDVAGFVASIFRDGDPEKCGKCGGPLDIGPDGAGECRVCMGEADRFETVGETPPK